MRPFGGGVKDKVRAIVSFVVGGRGGWLSAGRLYRPIPNELVLMFVSRPSISRMIERVPE
jgi:hypothetical protein